MELYERKYSLWISNWEIWDNIEFIVDELDRIKVVTYQERWRTKEEHIKLYKNIIKELKSFTP